MGWNIIQLAVYLAVDCFPGKVRIITTTKRKLCSQELRLTGEATCFYHSPISLIILTILFPFHNTVSIFSWLTWENLQGRCSGTQKSHTSSSGMQLIQVLFQNTKLMGEKGGLEHTDWFVSLGCLMMAFFVHFTLLIHLAKTWCLATLMIKSTIAVYKFELLWTLQKQVMQLDV